MNFFLSANADALQELTTKDAALQGLQMVLMGMGVVFAVLLTICLLLLCFRTVVGGVTDGRKPKKVEKLPEVTVAPVVVNTTSDDELIAVITAAIAAASQDSSGKSFRVVSFKRVRPNRR